MIEDYIHTDDFIRKLIVRMSGFGKNSVSKFWKNKKLNVLDMGYTLLFKIIHLFIKFFY